jgi:hypothetical protein
MLNLKIHVIKKHLQMRMQDRYAQKRGNLPKEQTMAFKKGVPSGRCIKFTAPIVHVITKSQQKANAVPKRYPIRSYIEITQVKISFQTRGKSENTRSLGLVNTS